MKETFALLLSYDGARFRGWQKQPGLPTVQAAVEDALRALLGKRYTLHGASRTDAGVHALGQVASFSMGTGPFGRRAGGSEPDFSALHLGEGLRLLRWARASPSFHARSSAVGKRYRYDFAQFVPDAKGPDGAERRAPDWDRARAALQALDGLSELSGLSSPSRAPRPAPPLSRWSLSDAGVLEVEGKAFRKHQVRNLAGHLAAVALGYAEPGSLRLLAQRKRPWMGATAPPHGLTLLEVLYPGDLDPFR
ncbi:MAG: tRNA pseudouridine(38-40) synthase TruA [Myxococcales bacterium]